MITWEWSSIGAPKVLSMMESMKAKCGGKRMLPSLGNAVVQPIMVRGKNGLMKSVQLEVDLHRCPKWLLGEMIRSPLTLRAPWSTETQGPLVHWNSGPLGPLTLRAPWSTDIQGPLVHRNSGPLDPLKLRAPSSTETQGPLVH